MPAEDQGPDVVGLTEAADILGVRPAAVRRKLQNLGIVGQELTAGPIWARDAVVRASQGKPSKRKPPRCVSTAEVATAIGSLRPNVRKWMDRRGVVPRVLALGPVWRESDLARARKITTTRWRGR